MPGCHTVIQIQDNALDFKKIERKFKATLKDMRHYPRYTTKMIINSKKVVSGFSGYSAYPFKIFRTESRIIIIEGKIYNRDEKEIIDLLSTISLEHRFLAIELKKFILNSDGEFVIHVYDTKKDFYFLFNDGLGRLPLYYCCSPERIIVSKEIKFIIPFLDEPKFNRMSLAECLLFRYPLGKRTLLKNVYRFLPATLFSIDIRNQSYYNKVLLSWNLDSKPMKPCELDKVTKTLLTLFVNSLRNRVNSFPNYVPVMSLSGGYDSRTVLTGLSKLKAHTISITYLNKQSRKEVPIAREISRILKMKHSTVPVPSQDATELSDMYWLVYLKDGLNYIGVCHVMKFYETIVNDLGNKIIGFTGEGGDLTLAPFSPFNPEAKRFQLKINSSKQLVRLITTINRFFSLKDVSLIFNIDEKVLKNNIETHLSSYPEQTFEGKFKHFKIFEKSYKWLSEGESRNRFFYWFTTPFYSLPFFMNVMKIPQVAKKNMKYYKFFLSKLNSSCAMVYYPISWKRVIKNELMQMASTPFIVFFEVISKVFDKRKKNEKGVERARKICLEVLENSKIASHCFNVNQTKRIIVRERSLTNLFILLTLLLYMQILDCSFSS